MAPPGSAGFLSTRTANGVVYAITVQADGRILAGGGFQFMGGQTRQLHRPARSGHRGVADSFDPHANNLAVYALAEQADGKILAGGDFTVLGAQAAQPAWCRNRIARLLGGFLYVVNTTNDIVLPGVCANGGHRVLSLRGAIQAANSHPGDDEIEIDLPAGSVINLTQVLPDVTGGVTIASPGANLVTVRRQTGGNYRIFNIAVPPTGRDLLRPHH